MTSMTREAPTTTESSVEPRELAQEEIEEWRRRCSRSRRGTDERRSSGRNLSTNLDDRIAGQRGKHYSGSIGPTLRPDFDAVKQVRLAEYSHQIVVFIDDRQGADVVLAQKLDRMSDRRVGMNRDGLADHDLKCAHHPLPDRH